MSNRTDRAIKGSLSGVFQKLQIALKKILIALIDTMARIGGILKVLINILKGSVLTARSTFRVCFHPDTLVSMKDGTKKRIEDITLGEKLQKGSNVIGTLRLKPESSDVYYRIKSKKLNDDIYVTGNIGDSFLGLQLLKKKISLTKAKEKYFVNKYYLPSLPINFSKNLVNFGNTSIDISDGLIADMKRLLNKQDLSFEIWLDKIPISNHLRSYINNNNKKKSEFLFNGDDYQILFTSSKENRKLIKNFSKDMNQKVTIIGQINQSNENSRVIDQNNVNFLGKYEGYLHKF